MIRTQIPNILTVSRILLSGALLFMQPLSLPFFILYTLCGISDVLDGFFARKLHIRTELGARLDSIADAVFTAVSIIILYPLLQLTPSIILWIVLITTLRILSIITAIIKFHYFAMLHTYGNKITGLCLFFLPFSLLKFPSRPIIICICLIAGISAAEELFIQLLSEKINLNRKNLFMK